MTGELTATGMKERWGRLVADMTAGVADRTAPPPEHRGSLTVLGSGIGHGDLTIETEQHLLAADHVFYSINDYVTKNWVNHLRPDAYDMALLYDKHVPRRVTYARMVEAMLHFVRRDERVVAIFYGHPGVFASPGHRAIAKAREEGHAARMRPGISALDRLIADVGFDPALPGILMYEATDMLLRRRRLDPTLHTVIWQVGIVGESGYRHQGYENRGLTALIDALEQTYGPDCPIIHYIGAQYAGVDPTIQKLSVSSLRKPTTARELTTLSTFYIAPQRTAATDAALASVMVAPEAHAPHGMRNRNRHEVADAQAGAPPSIRATFSSDYDVVRSGPVLDFLTAMSRDVRLQQSFEADPRSVLSRPTCAELTEWQKSLLLTRQQKAFVAAITGVPDIGRNAS